MLAMRVFYFVLLFSTATLAAWARPAEIILIRHAEKPPEEANLHLAQKGRERARALVPLLTQKAVFITNGPPAALFAARPTPRGHGQRTSETLEPLASALGLTVQTPYSSGEYASLARQILKDPRLDGKTVVICWVHESLPELAEALGVKRPPSKWKSSAFDRAWVITFHGKKAVLTDVPQQLLAGDSEL